MNVAQRIGFFLGPLLFVGALLYPVVIGMPEGMDWPMVSVLAIAILMAVWWMTEAIPIPVTALIPIALFPALGVMRSQDATAPYANHLIYLFIGGFFMAAAMEKWNLHRRVALYTIRFVGISPGRVVLGFMVATAFLSMWVSNTATAMMMVPVGIAVAKQVIEVMQKEGKEVDMSNFRFGASLMLGIAYAASIGGVATLIGTPPNTVLAGVVAQEYGQTITFAGWMALGLPLSMVFLLITWVVLTKIMLRPEIDVLPGGKELIDREIASLGPMTSQEATVLRVFGVVAFLWIFRGFFDDILSFFAITDTVLNTVQGTIADATISIGGALVMFCIPVDFSKREFLLDWETAVKIPWGVVVLFGGGLSLAAGVGRVGLADWMTGQLANLGGLEMMLLVGIIVAFAIFLTEVTSNTATATLLIPLMGALAITIGLHPYALMIAAGVATSYAFMLPVATPPNAVVFGSGQITIAQMARVGIVLNLIGVVLITLAVLYGLEYLWGLDLTVVPDWAVLPTPE